MDVERRLLLYVVVLGSAVGVGALVVRRASALRAHGLQLAVICAVATAGLLREPLGELVAWPVFVAWAAVAVVPSMLVQAGRHAAAGRRFGTAWRLLAFASGLLFLPRTLRREAQLYAAFDAGDRGDDGLCKQRLDAMARSGGGEPSRESEDLVRIVPAAAARRWDEVLRAVEVADRRNPVVLAAEANAACETGDLRRALRTAEELGQALPDATAALAQVRRAVLASAGRVTFLEEALRAGLPVAEGSPGSGTLALARALEASGATERASSVYREAYAATRGALRRDADEGRARCERGEPRLAHPDESENAALLDLEQKCRAEHPDASLRPLLRRAPACVALCAVTAVASVLVFLVFGHDMLTLVATGALSVELVRGDGEWWRLASAMLLHGGFVHLALNVTSVMVVGVPLEQRIGSVRTVIVYVTSGLVASMASVYLHGTHVGVGASGAGMGMFGALCALLVLRGHLFEHGERRQWFIACGLVFVSNAAIGWMERQAIDNAAHAGGLVAGVVLGWILVPRDGDTAARRGALRLVAVSLLALLAVAAGAVLRDLPEWTRSATVEARGVRVAFPKWLRVRDAGPLGAVAERQPLPFLVQIGRVDEVAPDPVALYMMAFGEEAPATPPVWSDDPEAARTDGDLVTEERAWTIASGGEVIPVRAVVFTRGGVFAAAVYPSDEEGRTAFERYVTDLGATLAPIPERSPR